MINGEFSTLYSEGDKTDSDLGEHQRQNSEKRPLATTAEIHNDIDLVSWVIEARGRGVPYAELRAALRRFVTS